MIFGKKWKQWVANPIPRKVTFIFSINLTTALVIASFKEVILIIIYIIMSQFTIIIANMHGHLKKA